MRFQSEGLGFGFENKEVEKWEGIALVRKRS